MSETKENTETPVTSPENFEKLYHKVIVELDALHKGVFDEGEAANAAALALLAQSSLLRILSSADLKARTLKRDIEFAKAEAYYELKQNPPDGKKITESALTQLILLDGKVKRLSLEQNVAEKEAKELLNILNLLRDAHITFRGLVKKGA